MKKHMPFSLYNTLLCLLTVAVFVLCILCTQTAEERWYLKWDLSEDNISTLSDYTLSRLEQLDENVTLYFVHGTENGTLHGLLNETLLRLTAASSRIRTMSVDPASQPQLLLRLAGDMRGIQDGTVFVQNESGRRTVRLEPNDFLFARRIGDEEYTIYCGEALLIGGIERITAENPAAVWFITGHGEPNEAALAQTMLQCRAMGMEVHVGALPLMEPSAGDIMTLIGMQSDLTPAEADILRQCLLNGVHLMVACDADTPFDRLTELRSLLDLYGLGYRSGWAVEARQETDRFVDNPALLSPQRSSDVSWLTGESGRLILSRACALQTPALRPGVAYQTLLSTSARAYLKNDIHARELAMQPGDESGVLPMAILAEAGDSSILQLASVQMLLTGSEADGSYVLDASDNLSFLSVCLGKMTERGSSATLDAGVKQLATQLITFDSQTQRQRVSALLLLLWPCLLGLALVIVRIVRRRL